MLEIIALIYLTRKISALAKEKGETPWLWSMYQVVLWIALEVLGVVGVMTIMGGDEGMIPGIIVGVALAVSSHFILKNILEQKATVRDELDEFAMRDQDKFDHFR